MINWSIILLNFIWNLSVIIIYLIFLTLNKVLMENL